MPLTPSHFGPALLVKSLAPRRFSWGAFIAATVVIDCETAYNIAGLVGAGLAFDRGPGRG